MNLSPGGCCSTLCHLLIQRPILIVALGLVGLVGGSGVYKMERDTGASQCAVTARPSEKAVQKLEQDEKLVLLTKAAEKAYTAVSTRDPRDDILAAFLGRVPACSSFSFEDAKRDSETYARLKQLYFMDLVHLYGVNEAIRKWGQS